MGYRQDDDLESLFDDAWVYVYAERVTIRVAERLRELVTEFTPVAVDPFGERDRTPGTLQRSWEIGTISFNGRKYSIEVYTEDPVGPHVEYPTRPHLIRPRTEGGPGARLRFRNSDGDVVYARAVHHPGTKGAYMMTRALAVLDEEWPGIAREELEREAALR